MDLERCRKSSRQAATPAPADKKEILQPENEGTGGARQPADHRFERKGASTHESKLAPAPASSKSHQLKISSRLFHVASDLLTQRLDRRKLDFITHPVEKTDLELALRRQLNGIKVQQVSFDRKRIRSKRWTIAHVRDGIETLRLHARTCDVNAILGH